MAAFVVTNAGLIARETQTLIAVFRIPAGVGRRTVIRVNDVAGRATAAAIIAGMIIRTHEAEHRIVQARLLQVQENGVNAVQRAESALGQTAKRPSRRFGCRRDAELKLLFPAAFEDAEDVAWLRDWKLRERFEKGEHAVRSRFLRRRNVGIEKFERLAVHTVSLAEAIIFQRIRAIVVERRAPKHRAVVHHAQPNVVNGFLVARAAGDVRDAQIAGVDEADELGRLVVQNDVRVGWVCGALPKLRVARGDVGFAQREAGRGISAVAIGAAEDDVRAGVHRMIFDSFVAFEAAATFFRRFSLGLINPISLGQSDGRIFCRVARDGNLRAETSVRRSTKRQHPSSREAPSTKHQASGKERGIYSASRHALQRRRKIRKACCKRTVKRTEVRAPITQRSYF